MCISTHNLHKQCWFERFFVFLVIACIRNFMQFFSARARPHSATGNALALSGIWKLWVNSFLKWKICETSLSLATASEGLNECPFKVAFRASIYEMKIIAKIFFPNVRHIHTHTHTGFTFLKRVESWVWRLAMKTKNENYLQSKHKNFRGE